jgi:hypothetical protein
MNGSQLSKEQGFGINLFFGDLSLMNGQPEEALLFPCGDY